MKTYLSSQLTAELQHSYGFSPIIKYGCKKNEPGGKLDDQELTVTAGLPPANASVVLMRRVRAPICEEEADHLIVDGLLTSLNCAIGNEEAEFPIVNVTGPQELMRVSDLSAR